MRRTLLPCVLVAAAIGAAYLLVAPVSADLAAAVFRSDLFARAGFVIVDDAWYGGHHVPAYSLLMPPLGALLGPRLVAVGAVVAAAGLFAALARGAYPRRDVRLGALWFAVGVALQLLTGRIPFLLGVPLALGALLAAQRGRPAVALGLSVATALASPVSGAFLALAGAAWAIGARRRLGLAIAACALAPVAALSAIFPEGGSEPFAASAFWPALAVLAIAAAALPREERVLRAGAVLYALAVAFCFVVPTAVGGNVTRLAALAAGPLVALVAWPRHRVALAIVAVPLLYWQLMPAIRDAVTLRGDPATQAAYYTPLTRHLAAIGATDGPLRIEVPFTRSHWEAALLAHDVSLARGWMRQLDRERNALFYDDAPLTAARYTAWLRENAIAFVAVPDVTLDASAQAEARLVAAGVPALREVWRDAHWTLYAVRDPTPLGVTAIGPDSFRVDLRRRDRVDVRVRFSPHWAVTSGAGCVSRAPGGFTRVRATRPGVLRVGARVDVVRALARRTGERCVR